MDYLIFGGALLGLLIIVYLIMFFIDYGKYGSFCGSINVGDSTFWLRSKFEYYKSYDWNEVSKYLTEFFKYNPDLKTDEFDKIEIYDYPYASNNEDRSKIVNGTIDIDVVIAWRFKMKDFIVVNSNDCVKDKVDNKGMANLILHEYCHLYQMRKLGDWDIDHANKVLWKKFII